MNWYIVALLSSLVAAGGCSRKPESESHARGTTLVRAPEATYKCGGTDEPTRQEVFTLDVSSNFQSKGLFIRATNTGTLDGSSWHKVKPIENNFLGIKSATVKDLEDLTSETNGASLFPDRDASTHHMESEMIDSVAQSARQALEQIQLLGAATKTSSHGRRVERIIVPRSLSWKFEQKMLIYRIEKEEARKTNKLEIYRCERLTTS